MVKEKLKETPPTFRDFKRYCLWWAKFFDLPLRLLTVEEHKEDDESRPVWARSWVDRNYGCMFISSFPILFQQPTSDVWETACHECLHLVTDPVIGWYRRFADLGRLPNATILHDEAGEKLEWVINSLSASLTKRLTVRELSATMSRSSLTSGNSGGAGHVRLLKVPSVAGDTPLPTADRGGGGLLRTG